MDGAICDWIDGLALCYTSSPDRNMHALQLAAKIDMYRLDLTVTFQSCFAKLTTDTRLLHTAKWHARVAVLATVDPDHTGFDIAGNSVSTLEVRCKDCGAKTIGAIVGSAEGFRLVFEA